MINPRLSSLCTGIPRRNNPNQIPPSLSLQHERPPRVPLTAVPSPILVSRTQHLIIDHHSDALGTVPPFAHPIVDDRHLHGLEGLGAQPGAGTEGAPSGRHADLAQEGFTARWQADGGDVGQLLGGAVQAEDGHVEAVRLGGEFEIGVYLEG